MLLSICLRSRLNIFLLNRSQQYNSTIIYDTENFYLLGHDYMVRLIISHVWQTLEKYLVLQGTEKKIKELKYIYIYIYIYIYSVVHAKYHDRQASDEEIDRISDWQKKNYCKPDELVWLTLFSSPTKWGEVMLRSMVWNKRHL